MLANFFGKSNPANFMIIFILFLGLYAANFFVTIPLETITTNDMIREFSMIGLFVLLFFFFNFILAKNKLTLYNSYGFLFFVLLLGIFPFTMFNRHELIVNVVLLIFLRRVYSLRTPKHTLKKLFDSGFWLSILFILSPLTLIYGILLYTSIAFFQTLNFKTSLVPIVGFIAPLICFFTYCFWQEDIERFLHLFYWDMSFDFQFYKALDIMIPLIFMGLIALISIIFKTPKVFLVSGNYRKFWSLTVINLLLAIGVAVLSKDKTGVELLGVFFPLSIILTNWIEGIKKQFFQNLIMVVFMIIPIVLLIV